MTHASTKWFCLTILAALVLASSGAAAGDKVQFKIVVTNNGKPATADYQLVTQASTPEIVSKGSVKGNAVIKVPPDSYKLRVTLTEAVDKAVETQDNVSVPSSGDGKVEIKFTTGTITLVIYKGGQKKTCKIKLRRPGGGEWLPAVQSGKAITLSPGEYEAEIIISNVSHTVHGLFVQAGGTQNIPVQL